VLDKVITGGQTGADQAAWRVARAFGIPTGGWMPLGFLTETADGKGAEPHPEFADLYGARETPTAPRCPPPDVWTFALPDAPPAGRISGRPAFRQRESRGAR
jgi:hypothetical protein